jgi:hypothetical protein
MMWSRTWLPSGKCVPQIGQLLIGITDWLSAVGAVAVVSLGFVWLEDGYFD